MSRAFSTKKPYLPPAPTAPPSTSFAKSAQRKKESPRNPLQDLNRISGCSNSSGSSSVSSEAPSGCLRFFLSHSSSSSSSKTPAHRLKYLSKTPNSAPSVLPLKQSKSYSSKENLSKGNSGKHRKKLTSEKAEKFWKNPPCLYQWQSEKKSGSKIGQKSKPCSVLNDHSSFLPRLPSASEESKQQEERLEGIDDKAGECPQLKSRHNDANLTPLSKKATESDLVHLDIIDDDRDVEENSSTSISKTPPIQNSVSPEIQCGSSLVSGATPACYGAGYVLSGVTDKRKCRPRGILTIEDNNSGFNKIAADSFDEEDEKDIIGVENNANAPLLPLPSEASMHWLCSPRNNQHNDITEKSENEPSEVSTTLGPISSPSSRQRIFLDASDSIELSSGSNFIKRKITASISPNGLPEFQGFSDSILSPSYLPMYFSPNSTHSCKAGTSEKGEKCQDNILDENSPFSLNSLGSVNVIQTPESDSSSDLHVGLSWVQADYPKEDSSIPDLDVIGEVTPSASFLSLPFDDSANSSFRFHCPIVPSDSIDLSKLPKFLDDQYPWLSSSTIENVSESQMRISWREGLMSQLYELDELDCCRCLSDEEDLANDCSSNKLPIRHGPQVNDEVDCDKKLNNEVKITETDDNELGIEGLGKEIFPALVSCLGAESISTDGGGLVASRDDSDWTLCYKNKLFEV